MIKVNCNTCKALLTRSPSKVEPRNFCNRSCYSVFRDEELLRRGKKFRWKKGRPEIANRIYAVKKLSDKNHYAWKGVNVSYRGLHQWVWRKKGKPTKCIHCGVFDERPKRVQWANVDGKYRRELEDYISLCASCHKKYDLNLRHLATQGVQLATR